MSDRSRPLSARAAVMSESFSPAELLDAEWPSHLLGEILDNLLEGDLTAKEEALAQRRLAKGAREDEDGENARTVLSACLRFAGKKLHGGDGGPAHHHKTASAQASNWCACALAVTRDAPPTASISSAAYDTFRGAFMRHENLGDVMLATTTRAAEKDGGSRRVSAFVALAAASSRTVRDAVDALAGCVSAMPIDDVDAFVDGLDERAAIDLLECAIAREDQTLATKTLPCLFRSKRECAGRRDEARVSRTDARRRRVVHEVERDVGDNQRELRRLVSRRRRRGGRARLGSETAIARERKAAEGDVSRRASADARRARLVVVILPRSVERDRARVPRRERNDRGVRLIHRERALEDGKGRLRRRGRVRLWV